MDQHDGRQRLLRLVFALQHRRPVREGKRCGQRSPRRQRTLRITRRSGPHQGLRGGRRAQGGLRAPLEAQERHRDVRLHQVSQHGQIRLLPRCPHRRDVPYRGRGGGLPRGREAAQRAAGQAWCLGPPDGQHDHGRKLHGAHHARAPRGVFRRGATVVRPPSLVQLRPRRAAGRACAL